ncbi:MAG: hypothetical protein M0R03_08655 [Novosphingobium sp.]|nr:hypothetical protein [Novosphingobium sp.]
MKISGFLLIMLGVVLFTGSQIINNVRIDIINVVFYYSTIGLLVIGGYLLNKN